MDSNFSNYDGPYTPKFIPNNFQIKPDMTLKGNNSYQLNRMQVSNKFNVGRGSSNQVSYNAQGDQVSLDGKFIGTAYDNTVEHFNYLQTEAGAGAGAVAGMETNFNPMISQKQRQEQLRKKQEAIFNKMSQSGTSTQEHSVKIQTLAEQVKQRQQEILNSKDLLQEYEYDSGFSLNEAFMGQGTGFRM